MIISSRYPDVTIPEVSLPGYIFENVDQWLDLPALIDGPTGRALSYRELRSLIGKVGVALTARGFRNGDALCIWSPNLPEYAAVFLVPQVLAR